MIINNLNRSLAIKLLFVEELPFFFLVLLVIPRDTYAWIGFFYNHNQQRNKEITV